MTDTSIPRLLLSEIMLAEENIEELRTLASVRALAQDTDAEARERGAALLAVKRLARLTPADLDILDAAAQIAARCCWAARRSRRARARGRGGTPGPWGGGEAGSVIPPSHLQTWPGSSSSRRVSLRRSMKRGP